MPVWFVLLVVAASGASDQGVWGAFAPFHGCSSDNFGGRGRLRRPEIVLQKAQTSVVSLSLVEKFIGGFVDTGEHIIGGVVDSGEQFFPGVVDTGQK